MLYIIETIYNNMNKDTEIATYMAQLKEQQLKALMIAKNHLGSSFNIYKSNGFIEWKNANKINK